MVGNSRRSHKETRTDRVCVCVRLILSNNNNNDNFDVLKTTSARTLRARPLFPIVLQPSIRRRRAYQKGDLTMFSLDPYVIIIIITIISIRVYWTRALRLCII